MSHDIFGHKIKLNLDKGGASHKTFVTGLASLAIKILLVVYIYLQFQKIVNEGDGDLNAT